MLKYDEIKDTITNKLGIVDIPSYQTYIDTLRGRLLTEEEIALLSPDNVNSRDFWKVCLELFGPDPIAHSGFGKFPNQQEHAFKRNLVLAAKSGITDYILLYKALTTESVLEIGTGFGTLREFIRLTSTMSYTGIDVVNPENFNDVVLAKENGTFPDEDPRVNSSKFGLAIAHNVFQHMSRRQINSYVLGVQERLAPNGIFIFNVMLSDERKLYFRSREGHRYMAHYGQFVKIPSFSDFYENVVDSFEYKDHRLIHPGFYVFRCWNRGQNQGRQNEI
jgi:SAM-dependent methyltransferase